MYQELMKMMGRMEVVARRVDGSLIAERGFCNVVTNSGKLLAARMFNTCTDGGVIAIGLGSASVAFTATANALNAEYTTAGLSRAAATTSNVITTTSGDTARWVNTFTCTVDGSSVSEEGVFQRASGGMLAAAQTFAAITLNSGDTLEVRHNISFA